MKCKNFIIIIVLFLFYTGHANAYDKNIVDDDSIVITYNQNEYYVIGSVLGRVFVEKKDKNLENLKKTAMLIEEVFVGKLFKMSLKCTGENCQLTFVDGGASPEVEEHILKSVKKTLLKFKRGKRYPIKIHWVEVDYIRCEYIPNKKHGSCPREGTWDKHDVLLKITYWTDKDYLEKIKGRIDEL